MEDVNLNQREDKYRKAMKRGWMEKKREEEREREKRRRKGHLPLAAGSESQPEMRSEQPAGH